jgi:arginyl-tRNA synthetase
LSFDSSKVQLSKIEKRLLVKLYQYPLIVKEAGRELSPGVICNYIFDLAKAYSSFYHDHQVLNEGNLDQRAFRILTCKLTAQVIQSGFKLLGISVPEKM